MNLLPIPTILQIADISQYLAANDISQGKKLKSGFLAPALSVQIFLAKTIVRWIYNLNPSDASLIQTSNYLFQLLGGYVNQAQSIINSVAGGIATITNPANVAINVGQNATFSVTVTSASPYTIVWYRNGVAIPGANGLSYTLSNAQLSDTGSTFYAVATNAAGPIASNVATLTVIALLQGQFYWGSTDYSTELLSGIDNVPYNGTFTYTSGQPLSVQFPSGAANNQYIVVSYPSTESTKTNYSNLPLNNGTIPSIAFENIVTIGSNKKIFSRTGNPFSQNTANPVIFS